MTQKYVLPLNGAMNRDSAPAYMKPEEVYERRNARIVTTNGKNGFNNTLKGTTLLGTYTGHEAVGSVEDVKRDRMIMFLSDSVSNLDKIIAVSRTGVSTLYESALFNFGQVSCDIIDDWLVFTDNVNPPRKLNIVTPVTVDAQNCQLAVRPPRQAPSVSIGSDSSRKVNLLINKTFQFAYQFIYKGYEYSTISQYSELCIAPSLLYTSDMTYTDDSIGNFITISFDYGTTDVLKVRIVAREGNIGNWFVVDEIDRPDVTEYYPVSINFYNDKARKNIPSSEALLLYSDVPILANTVSIVKNRVALGNVVKGYDTQDVPANYSIEYGTVGLSANSTDFAISDAVDAGTNSFFVGINLPVSVSVGDIITISIDGRFVQYSDNTIYSNRIVDYSFFYSFSYVVQAGDTIPDIISKIESDINSKSGSIVTKYNQFYSTITVGGVIGYGSFDVAIQFMQGYFFNLYKEPDPMGVEGEYQLENFLVNGSVTLLPSNYVTFHSGSYYNVGVSFYDTMGRTSGVLSQSKVYVPSNGERTYADAYKQARIRFNIQDFTPPSWASYYRFVVSESVNLTDSIPFVTWYASAKKIFDTYIDNTPVFAIAIPQNISYEYIFGDYVVFEKDSGSAITTIVKNIIGTRVEIEDGGDTYSGLFLIVPKSGESTSDFEGNVAYINRPKSEVKDTVFFEDFNTYLINNGQLSTTTGLITCGDTWFVQRDYKWDSSPLVTKVVEDLYITRSFATPVYSKGRAIVDFGDLGRQKRLQHVVWSKQYLDNTKINGLAFFESTSRVELDEKNGVINGLVLDGDILKVIQEDKETSLYVGKQQVTNADGSLTLTSTANFIGTVYPLLGSLGSRYKKSVVVNDGVLYYWDGKRGEVVRSSNNGQQSLSQRGMNSYFAAMKQTLESAYESDVVFHFDRRYAELIVAFTWKPTATAPYLTDTVVYSEILQGWSYFYDLSDSGSGVSCFGRIGEANYAYCANKLYELDSNTSNNTIFGAYKLFSVTGYMNVSPDQEKVLKSVLIDSNIALGFTAESDLANTRLKGNYTLLVPDSFRKREGLWCSTVNRNVRIASGATNLSQLYSGNLMTGKWFKIVLTNSGSGTVELRFVHIGINPST